MIESTCTHPHWSTELDLLASEAGHIRPHSVKHNDNAMCQQSKTGNYGAGKNDSKLETLFKISKKLQARIWAQDQ